MSETAVPSSKRFSLHDAVSGELLGVPSVAVMTEEFVSAAELMSRVLGADGYPFVVIPHPISSAGPEELAERARMAAEVCRVHLARTGD
jgi:hypothetical protein